MFINLNFSRMNDDRLSYDVYRYIDHMTMVPMRIRIREQSCMRMHDCTVMSEYCHINGLFQTVFEDSHIYICIYIYIYIYMALFLL